MFYPVGLCSQCSSLATVTRTLLCGYLEGENSFKKDILYIITDIFYPTADQGMVGATVCTVEGTYVRVMSTVFRKASYVLTILYEYVAITSIKTISCLKYLLIYSQTVH